MSDDENLLTAEQVAERLGCSPRTVTRLTDRGELACVAAAATRKWAQAAVDSFIERHTEKSDVRDAVKIKKGMNRAGARIALAERGFPSILDNVEWEECENGDLVTTVARDDGKRAKVISKPPTSYTHPQKCRERLELEFDPGTERLAPASHRAENTGFREMPDVPDIFRRLQDADIPGLPGIYFMRDETGRIAYVGKAASLVRRLTRGHNKLREGDRVAWIVRPLETVSVDELYYIWLLRPCRNAESQPYQAFA